MNIEPIEDVDTNSTYIADLEHEIDSLRKELKRCKKPQALKQVVNDQNCCESLKVLRKSFHKLLDDLLPF